MTKADFPIKRITSNVDRKDAIGKIFSRDCPQFEVQTPSGDVIHVLVNHFKSQSGGGGDKRQRRADAVRVISDQLIADEQHVVVLGDFNEGPTDVDTTVANFAALYKNDSPLVDCFPCLNLTQV